MPMIQKTVQIFRKYKANLKMVAEVKNKLEKRNTWQLIDI